MVNIAVCDDEKFFIEKIVDNIHEYYDVRNIDYSIDTYSSGVEFLDLKEKLKKYDIVFLDINMPGIDGIETARLFRKYCPETILIFVTAYIKYTLDGYKVEAIRYVLKDIDSMDVNIHEAIEAAMKKIKLHNVRVKYDFVNVGTREIEAHKIIYIENILHKLKFHIADGDDEIVLELYRKLDDLQKDFLYEKFVRTHQSYLVNMEYVRGIKRYELTLKNGKTVSISKLKFNDVKDEYLKHKGVI